MASPEEDLILNEGNGKIFVVYNTSTTVTPAYAATLVLVFGLGWIALIAAVYYYLIFGTNKYSESYSNSYSQRRSWFLGGRKKRDFTEEEENKLAQIVQSLGEQEQRNSS